MVKLRSEQMRSEEIRSEQEDGARRFMDVKATDYWKTAIFKTYCR